MLKLRITLCGVVVCTTDSAWVLMGEGTVLIEVEFTMTLGNLLVVLLCLLLALGIVEMIA